MKIVATNGTDNIEILKVNYEGLPIDFTVYGVTRIDVIAGDITMSSGGGNVSYTDSQISIKFGKMGLAVGKYDVIIKLITPTSPNGVVIVGPERPQCIVLFVS